MILGSCYGEGTLPREEAVVDKVTFLHSIYPGSLDFSSCQSSLRIEATSVPMSSENPVGLLGINRFRSADRRNDISQRNHRPPVHGFLPRSSLISCMISAMRSSF